MEVKSKNKTDLFFTDAIGTFSVLNDTVFLPKISAFNKLSSLKEAEEKLAVLSTVAFYGKTLLTHGTIYNREYLFFYSHSGNFESSRILNNKIDSLSFFSHQGFRLIVLLARELQPMLRSKSSIKTFFNKDHMKDRKPRMAVIFESEKLKKGITAASFDVNDVFDETEVVFFLGEDIREVRNKEGTLLLC